MMVLGTSSFTPSREMWVIVARQVVPFDKNVLVISLAFLWLVHAIEKPLTLIYILVLTFNLGVDDLANGKIYLTHELKF